MAILAEDPGDIGAKANTFLESMRPHRVRKEPLNWARQAEADLKTAGDCFQAGNYYASAFFCQQASEKALKALYIAMRAEPPPRSHNLAEISQDLNVPREILSFLRSLTPEFIVSRYPDAAGGPPCDLYDEANTRPILEGTRKVVSWAIRKTKT